MALHPEVELSTDEQKVSYGFGLQFGDQLRRNQFEGMGLDVVMVGIQHKFSEQQPLLSSQELSAASPPNLAYGEQGAGESIPPNTALVFEIHLIDIKN